MHIMVFLAEIWQNIWAAHKNLKSSDNFPGKSFVGITIEQKPSSLLLGA